VRARFVIALSCAVFAPCAGVASEPPAEPDSYRMADYRAPTPATLKGARVLTTAEAHEIWRQGAAVFIDVLPQAPRPANLAPEVVWRDKPRSDIPGSVWLPDTGYGALAPIMEAYFRAGLRKATGEDASKTIVFYCLRDCWMSWNAAKRAVAFDYRNVDWYPDGTDGWSAAGFPLEIRSPEPRP
jgi:PQQ-dependent catabolism-associated CXXCW motif protein